MINAREFLLHFSKAAFSISGVWYTVYCIFDNTRLIKGIVAVLTVRQFITSREGVRTMRTINDWRAPPDFGQKMFSKNAGKILIPI